MHSIEQLQQLYRDYASTQRFTQAPAELYDPLNYILALGGKAMRPALVLAGCSLFSDNVQAALPAAYGVELFHNFSLMHDDIMDAAPTRRGKATVHHQYDVNTAILSGDVMLVYAYQYIGQVESALLPTVFRIFNETAIGVCEGQRYDMNFETQSAVAMDEYIRMIELKTAILLWGSLQIGALIGGAGLDQATLVGEFGRNLGIAFQLQDDYLDTFGDAAKFGKRIGGDIVQNKKTYLYLQALQRANAQQRQTLLDWFAQSVPADQEETKIAAVTQLYRDLDIPSDVQTRIHAYHQAALDALAQVRVPETRRQPLIALLAQLLGREI